MHYTIRPLGRWPQEPTENRQSSGAFRSTWDATLSLLAFELGQLDADHAIIYVDAKETDIRIDGMLKAHAEVDFPGVKIQFQSRHGLLTYSTDAYEKKWSGCMPGWQANVRAIALGLVALRAADRYGISTRGEQYTGYLQITAGTTAIGGTSMDRDTAMKVIADESGMALEHLEAGDAKLLDDAILRARRRTHPDKHQGEDGAWNAVEVARQVLRHETE